MTLMPVAYITNLRFSKLLDMFSVQIEDIFLSGMLEHLFDGRSLAQANYHVLCLESQRIDNGVIDTENSSAIKKAIPQLMSIYNYKRSWKANQKGECLESLRNLCLRT